MAVTTIHRSALLPYSAEQIYQLVNRIEEYPQFLPWCSATEVKSRAEEEIVASITVNAKGISQTFTTCNRLTPNKSVIMDLVDGPFKTFKSEWHFESLPEGCKVILDMEFEFASKVLGMVVKPFFTQAVNGMVEAFSARARELYS